MEILDKIKSTLKKKDESIVFDLYLKDYDKSNFYFALVFNKNIEKFKVLYVPIDAIGKNDKVEEYFCYQFIFLHTVNYMLETIHDNEDTYRDLEYRNRKSKTMDAYYIEINTHVASKDYQFIFTQFIDKDFMFLFDIIVVLFEHLPNIVSELCKKLLIAFNDKEDVLKFTNSYTFDLEHDLEQLFSKDIINYLHYTYDDISFIEDVGHRYYMILNDNIFMIEYSKNTQLLNIYSGEFDPLGEEIYLFIMAIKDEICKKFYRLRVCEEKDDFFKHNDFSSYYFCYGIDNSDFKVICSRVHNRLDLELLKKEKVQILNCDEALEKEIISYLDEFYEEKRIKEILDFVIIK